jgi:hypothetical protein
MTKTQFLQAYMVELAKRYDWANDNERLVRFIRSVQDTISTDAATWNHDGAAVSAAWRSIGGKGKPTLRALRGLE